MVHLSFADQEPSENLLISMLSKRYGDKPLQRAIVKRRHKIGRDNPNSSSTVYFLEVETTDTHEKTERINLVEKRYRDKYEAIREGRAFRFFYEVFKERDRGHIPYCYGYDKKGRVIKDYIPGEDLSVTIEGLDRKLEALSDSLKEELDIEGKEHLTRRIENLRHNKLEFATAVAVLAGKFHYFSAHDIARRASSRSRGKFLGIDWPHIGVYDIVKSFREDLTTLFGDQQDVNAGYIDEVTKSLEATNIPYEMNGSQTSNAALLIGDLHPRNVLLCVSKDKISLDASLEERLTPSSEILPHLKIIDLGKSRIGNRVIDLVDIFDHPAFEIMPYDDRIDFVLTFYANAYASYTHSVATGENYARLREQAISFSPVRCIRSAANVNGESRKRYIALSNTMMRRDTKYKDLLRLLGQRIPAFSE